MKIVVKLVIEVDPKAWNLSYGCGDTAAEVREDVRSYALGSVRDSAGMDETGATVELA